MATLGIAAKLQSFDWLKITASEADWLNLECYNFDILLKIKNGRKYF